MAFLAVSRGAFCYGGRQRELQRRGTCVQGSVRFGWAQRSLLRMAGEVEAGEEEGAVGEDDGAVGQDGEDALAVFVDLRMTDEVDADEEEGAIGQDPDDPRTGKVKAPRPNLHGRRRALIGKVRKQGRTYVDVTPSPQLRITGGDAKGRKLKSPEVYMRPMMGKVREALYSMLGQFDVLEGGTVLDLFCGSGSVGLEALSRGMDRGIFVDLSPVCTDVTLENIKHCGFEGRADALCCPAEGLLRNPERFGVDSTVRLVTLSPPYEEVDYGLLMSETAKSSVVGEGTFVVVEYPIELGSLASSYNQRLVGIRNRRYGRTILALYACQPDRDTDPRPDEFDNPSWC